MARFFMAGTNLLGGPTAIIRGRDAEHIQVLRIRPGEDVTICDTEGKDYKCRLVRADKEEAELEVVEVVPCKGEPSVSVTVLFPLSGCCSSSLFEQPVITAPINARAAMLKYLIVFVIASSI